MIRRIELVNFMSHARTVIEPADGLTALVGPNNCGKSAVVAALQILCHNETSTYVMRHGERECSVTVETTEGKIVQWRRRKSPAYFVDGTELSRLERSEVPEEVVRALRLGKVSSDGAREFDVHFGEQKSPVFLLDQSGSHAAQFFASSSDAASLVEMQKRHQQRMSDARKERIRLDAEAERLARDLAVLADADPIGVSIQGAEVQHAVLEQISAGIVQLTDDLRFLHNASSRLEQCDADAAALTLVQPPPSLEPTEPLSRLVGQLTQTGAEQARQSALADALVQIRPAPVLVDELPLSRLTGDLSVAARTHDRLGAECDMVQPLVLPPHMTDADSLKALVREMAAVNHRMAGTQQRTTVLGSLATSPSMANEAAITHDLDLLRRGFASLGRADAAFRQLEHLTPPVELTDSTEISRLLTELTQSHAVVGVQDQQVSQVADELQQAEAALRRWAEDHRVCPTCGGTLDPARVAEHARMHGGSPHA